MEINYRSQFIGDRKKDANINANIDPPRDGGQLNIYS
jgi:hypothetical protein